MVFKVREICGEAPALSLSGVDYDYDYLHEARAKMSALEPGRAMLTVWLGGHPVEASAITNAVDAGVRAKLDAIQRMAYPGLFVEAELKPVDALDEAELADLEEMRRLEPAMKIKAEISVIDQMYGRA